eukprot:2404441-Rhodomonas_salina.2
MLWSYAFAMRCPVLTRAMLLQIIDGLRGVREKKRDFEPQTLGEVRAQIQNAAFSDPCKKEDVPKSNTRKGIFETKCTGKVGFGVGDGERWDEMEKKSPSLPPVLKAILSVLTSAYHGTRQASTGWCGAATLGELPYQPTRVICDVRYSHSVSGATRGAECVAQGQCSYAMSGTHIPNYNAEPTTALDDVY